LARSITRRPAVAVRAGYSVEHFPGPKHYSRLLKPDSILLVGRTRLRLSAHTTAAGRRLPVDGTSRLLGAQCAIRVVCVHPRWPTAAVGRANEDSPSSSGSDALHHSDFLRNVKVGSVTRLFAVARSSCAILSRRRAKRKLARSRQLTWSAIADRPCPPRSRATPTPFVPHRSATKRSGIGAFPGHPGSGTQEQE